MKSRKILTALVAVSAMIGIFCSCSANRTEDTQNTSVIMGSVVTVQPYCKDKKSNDKLKKDIIEEIKRVDLVISKNNPESELYGINQNSGKDNNISQELFDYIWDTTDIYSLSGNKVSVTSGTLTELWGIDTEEFRLPDDSEIKKAIPLCLDSNIRVTENDLKISIGVQEGQIFNLGSVGKGIACDKAVEMIASKEECEGAVVSVGGSVAVFGTHDGKDAWTVGIRDPYGSASDIFAKLNVKNSFISTSGNYEKKFTIDGKNYHHILDLETGYPVENDLVAVTVVASSGLESDAFSTMCYVLGEEESRKLLEMYEAEAVFIYSDKTVSVTNGLKESLEIINDDYSLK